MQTNNLLILSITKGLIIAGVLVCFHILDSRHASPQTKILRVANHQDSPFQEKESKFVVESYSVNAVINFVIIREMLVLVIVVFNINAAARIFNLIVPIPLGRHFRILFSFVISPNAP